MKDQEGIEKKVKEVLESSLHQVYGYSQARYAPDKEIDYNDKDKAVIKDLINQAVLILLPLMKKEVPESKKGSTILKINLEEAGMSKPLMKNTIRIPKKKENVSNVTQCSWVEDRNIATIGFNEALDKVISLNKGAEIEEVEQ